MTTGLKLKFWVAVGLQIFILCSVWGFNHLQFIGGERILLKLSPPRDPLSLLQGHYLRLDYEISEIGKEELSGYCDQVMNFSQIKRGDKVYVYLAKKGNYWQPQAVCSHKSKEANITSLKAEVVYSHSNWLRLSYGIESYFIPEKNWREVELAFQKATRNQDIFIEVSVSSFGNAFIRKIFIDDQEIDIRKISEGEQPVSFESGSAGNRARDSHIISALAQMRTVMVYTFSNDGTYDNFNCQFGDMQVLCQEVISQGGEANVVVFPAVDSTEACIYSVLLASENPWYCADSTGRAGFTQTFPGSSGFCVANESAKCPLIIRP